MTGYGLGGPGIKSGCGRGEIFRTCLERPWGPPSPLYNGYQVFPGVKSGRGVTLTNHPLLVPWSLYSTPPIGRTVSTEPQCLYSTSIPLLPLWAVRPIQSLSPCTVQLYLYSPYRPYGLYRASVPVQYTYTSTPPMDRTACTDPRCLYTITLL